MKCAKCETVISGLCPECEESNRQAYNITGALITLGHTRSCAIRQAYSGGICECNSNPTWLQKDQKED